MKLKIKEIWNKYQNKFTVLFSWLRIPTFAVLIGFLGALGGSKNSSLLWRRCGISLVLSLLGGIVLFKELGFIKSLFAIFLMTYWIGASLGYGIPDDSDEGSVLGRFWYKLTKKSQIWSNILTRGTVGLVQSISPIVIPILVGNWLWYFIGAIGIILSQALFSWRSWGEIKINLFNKELQFNWSDIVCYTCQGICFYIIICFR